MTSPHTSAAGLDETPSAQQHAAALRALHVP